MSEDQQQQLAPEVPPVEAEARHQGWVPKEEFRGSEEDWIDADTFVKRGKEINPILKKNNERLLRELDSQKKQMEELRKATEEFKKFQKDQFEHKAVTLEAEIRDLKEQKRVAITQGDGDLAVNLDDKIDALKEEKQQAKEDSKEAPAPQAVKTQEDPELSAWVEKNSWYKNDVRMAAATNVIAEDIHASKPWLKGAAFLAELDEALEGNFAPERLGRTTKKTVRSPVEGSTGGSSSSVSGKQTYDKLPAEAKAACDMFVKQKLITRDQYLADYNN